MLFSGLYRLKRRITQYRFSGLAVCKSVQILRFVPSSVSIFTIKFECALFIYYLFI